MSALEALCDYALYKSIFTLHYIMTITFSQTCLLQKKSTLTNNFNITTCLHVTLLKQLRYQCIDVIAVVQLQMRKKVTMVGYEVKAYCGLLVSLSAAEQFQLNGSVKEPNISIYIFLFLRPSLNGVPFLMFCLLVKGVSDFSVLKYY